MLIAVLKAANILASLECILSTSTPLTLLMRPVLTCLRRLTPHRQHGRYEGGSWPPYIQVNRVADLVFGELLDNVQRSCCCQNALKVGSRQLTCKCHC